MRIKHKVNVRITRDSAGKNNLFAPDDSLAEVTIDDYNAEANTEVYVLATIRETLSFGDVVAVKGCYLEVDAACEVYVNDSLTPIALVVPTNGTKAKLFLEATLTKVELKAGAAAVSGVFCVWGNRTA